MASQNEKTCFVIAPIGEAGTETRKRSDEILEHIIRPAVEPLGYRAIRADEINEPGIITSQIVNHVLEDDLVIAGLTDWNPNVFYELAVRHAVRKPVILMIRDGESIPFDVASARTIHLDHHDLDRVGEAKKQIAEQAEALERAPDDLENPISVSLDLQRLRQSENPEQRSLADMVPLLSEIRGSLSVLDDRLSTRDERLMSRELSILHQLRNSQMEILQHVVELRSIVPTGEPSGLLHNSHNVEPAPSETGMKHKGNRPRGDQMTIRFKTMTTCHGDGVKCGRPTWSVYRPSA